MSIAPGRNGPAQGNTENPPLIAAGDPDDRRSLMTACGAGALCDRVGLGKPGERFASELLTKLEGRGPAGNLMRVYKQGFSPPSADAEVQQAQPTTILDYPKSL